MIANLKPKGALASVRAELFRPDVVGDSNWRNGFDSLFYDADKQLAIVPFGDANWLFWINTNQVKDGQITSVKDLLRPEWRGKLLFADIQNGNTLVAMGAIRRTLGDDVVKMLIVDQRPTIMRDTLQITEAMVRGRFPVAIGVTPQNLNQFKAQGLGNSLKRVDLPEARNISSNGSVMRFKNAPHPNATKLFLNWFLTKNGQTTYSAALQENSLRTDVTPFDAEFAPIPGVKYLDMTKEANSRVNLETLAFLSALPK
jgi:iron(III) transport system substrate-binding protein